MNLLIDFVSFDVSTTGLPASFLGYTDLLHPSTNAVSDRFVAAYSSGSSTYHVEFGSVGMLPAIPGGASVIAGLPNPYYANGDFQTVGTLTSPPALPLDGPLGVDSVGPGGTTDTFSVRSDVAPEPQFSLMLALLLLVGFVFARARRISTAA